MHEFWLSTSSISHLFILNRWTRRINVFALDKVKLRYCSGSSCVLHVALHVELGYDFCVFCCGMGIYNRVGSPTLGGS